MHRRARRSALTIAAAVVAAFAVVIAACSGSGKQATPPASPSPTIASSDLASGKASASPTPTGTPAADLKLLKVTPDNGFAGTAITITGETLPANQDVTVSWDTVDGSYSMTATPENVMFKGKVYKDRRVNIGQGHVGADGTVSVQATVPEDFGEVHNIYLQVNGYDIARGGFRINRQVSVSPASGPIGTPITVTIKGLGDSQYDSVVAVRYDNMAAGIVTATTTRGTTEAVIRASGTAGPHTIDIDQASRSAPFLNNQQSGTANIPDLRFTFTITDDQALPPNTLDWPDPGKLGTSSSAAPRTGSSTVASNPNFSVTPSSSPILTTATVAAKGLTPNAAVELVWVTAHGNRVSPSGWSLSGTSLTKANVGADGNLSAGFQVPDDLGGWHVVQVVSNSKVLAELPYFVQHSIAGVTPQVVKAGQVFTIHLKGIGWTELDNGVAVDYDNSYIGFACGFNSQGDVTMNLVASGAPGIHLIDIYPMIYQGHGEAPWGYEWPLLSYKVDAPGLSLGYNLPAYRLAIEVTN